MIIWRITGNEIGPEGNGASHFATKAEAEEALEYFRAATDKDMGDGPEKIVVKNRAQLARRLNEAMGYGAT